jgi:hypothetical protein
MSAYPGSLPSRVRIDAAPARLAALQGLGRYFRSRRSKSSTWAHVLSACVLGALAGCAHLKQSSSAAASADAVAPGALPERAAPKEVTPSPEASAARPDAPPMPESSRPTPDRSLSGAAQGTDSAAGATRARPTTESVSKKPPPAAPAAHAAAPASGGGPPDKPHAATLDLASLGQRLRDTRAIGVFTKLSLKNQMDDLLAEFKAFHRGQSQTTLADLRQRYEALLLKVLTLLQDADAPLAAEVASSREAIWGILTDPKKFAAI